MGQPGQSGTDSEGFGPTRFERGTQTVTEGTAPLPNKPPLVSDRAASKEARQPAPVPKGPPAPNGAPIPGAPIPGAPTAATPIPGAPAPGAPASGAPVKAAAPVKATKTPRVRGPRRARLQLRNVNVWTVFRFACVLSLFLFLVWLIVVMLLYAVLNASGVVGDINRSVTTINGPGSTGVVNGGRVFGYALILGAVNAVLFIAISTVGSFVYNLCADLVGGVEVTLSEREA